MPPPPDSAAASLGRSRAPTPRSAPREAFRVGVRRDAGDPRLPAPRPPMPTPCRRPPSRRRCPTAAVATLHRGGRGGIWWPTRRTREWGTPTSDDDARLCARRGDDRSSAITRGARQRRALRRRLTRGRALPLRLHDDDVAGSYAPRYELGARCSSVRAGTGRAWSATTSSTLGTRATGELPPRETVTRISEPLARLRRPGSANGVRARWRHAAGRDAPDRARRGAGAAERGRAGLHGSAKRVPRSAARLDEPHEREFVEAGGRLPPKVVDADAADGAVN